MAYVSVDVDMDEFTTDELVDALVKRFKYEGGRKFVSKEQKQELKKHIQPLNEALNAVDTNGIDIKSLEDKMKYEHISNVWEKYSSSEMERLLPLK